MVCRSQARTGARTQSCSRRPSKPQVTGQLQLQLSFSCVRVCAVARLSGVDPRSSTLEYSNTRAGDRDKGSTSKYAAATGYWWCCSCNPMKRVRSYIRIRSRGVAACLEARRPRSRSRSRSLSDSKSRHIARFVHCAPSTCAACIPRSSE